jgi:hypothetical protein
MVAHMGPGQISQVIPEAAPEGLACFAYDSSGVRLALAYSYTSRRLRTLDITWPA